MTAPNAPLEHIETIIARIGVDLAHHYAREGHHAVRCPFWHRIDPTACTCSCRPMIDLLLHIARRNAA